MPGSGIGVRAHPGRAVGGVRRLARALLSAVSIGWLVFLLEPLSGTGLGYPYFTVAFAVTVVVGIVALGLVLTQRPFCRVGLALWLAYPLAAAALVVLFVTSQSPSNPLFRLRLHLSRPALDDVARDALAGHAPTAATWVGLFSIRRVDVYPPDAWLISDGCGIVDECGLAYVPGTLPPGRKIRLRHIDGPWHHLYAVF